MFQFIRDMDLKEEGRREGLREGRLKVQLETTRNLLDILDDEIISKVTDLPREKVKEIRRENN